jgi:hypothetical protein
MRLSDAGLRRRQTKLIYPNHRPSPWSTEDAVPRSLEPLVRRQHTATTLSMMASENCSVILFAEFENGGAASGAISLPSTIGIRANVYPWRVIALRLPSPMPSLRPSRYSIVYRRQRAERSVRLVAAETRRPSKSQPRDPRTPQRIDRQTATLMRRPLILKVV